MGVFSYYNTMVAGIIIRMSSHLMVRVEDLIKWIHLASCFIYFPPLTKVLYVAWIIAYILVVACALEMSFSSR